jgi:phosphoglycolate phosphatase
MTSGHGEAERLMTARTLVLWDVDHTLIETRGVGAELFRDAFEEATGHRLEHAAEVTGRTEPAIFRETADLHSIPWTSQLLDRYAGLLKAGYRGRMDELAARGRAIPGAAQAIGVLADAGGITQSVLTGNLREVAEVKLDAFGLASQLDLEVGAFGSDDPVRARLVQIAQRRAGEKYDVRFDARTTVLIGDTPSDVDAARDGGARIVAVATGKSSVTELRLAGASIVLPDLTDTAALARAVIDGG